MNASEHVSPIPPPGTPLQRRFLALVPRIELHATIYFRHVRCPVRKADFIAETIALCWQWFLRLAERGKDAAQFVTALASFATRAVRSGRRLCGKEKSREVLSPMAQQRQGFVVGSLPQYSLLASSPLMDALIDNRRSPVPDQAAFRLDFPTWLATLSARDRRIAQDMALGERTLGLAQKYGLSAPRISQLRRQFQSDWEQFGRDGVDDLDAHFQIGSPAAPAAENT